MKRIRMKCFQTAPSYMCFLHCTRFSYFQNHKMWPLVRKLISISVSFLIFPKIKYQKYSPNTFAWRLKESTLDRKYILHFQCPLQTLVIALVENLHQSMYKSWFQWTIIHSQNLSKSCLTFYSRYDQKLDAQDLWFPGTTRGVG